MSGDVRGVPGLDLDPGEYAIVPAEWRRDAGEQLRTLTSGSGEGDEPIWHLHDVERVDGPRVMAVYEDRRAMEGTFQTSGRQFLFRSPDGDPLMAYEREGVAVGTTATLEDVETGEVLASWRAPGLLGRLLRTRWVLSGPDGTRRATAERAWSLGALQYPTYELRSAEGTAMGEFDARRDGGFHAMDVSLEPSPIPNEVLLAKACGILWASSQGSSGGAATSGG